MAAITRAQHTRGNDPAFIIPNSPLDRAGDEKSGTNSKILATDSQQTYTAG
jgi:hypothetical protein